jgi:DNA helicase-2/ATP-dependent DNA helicase PcrA
VQKVTLMTLHAAKGLEFPVVFIVGCEDDLIPLRRSEKDECQEDEERRLFFVAMTRAKEQLFLTWARRRNRFGKTLTRKLSPFVEDVSQDLLVRQEPVYGKKRRQVQAQMKFF